MQDPIKEDKRGYILSAIKAPKFMKTKKSREFLFSAKISLRISQREWLNFLLKHRQKLSFETFPSKAVGLF